jgi:hypothetical protein
MRTHTTGRELHRHRDRGDSLRAESCKVCGARAAIKHGGITLCRDCADAGRPYESDDPYDDVSAAD